jgi:hypothetical protein
MSVTLVHWCWPTSEHTMSITHPSSSRHHCLSILDDSKGQSCMTAVLILLERHCMDSVIGVEGMCIGARGIDHVCIRVEGGLDSVRRRSSEKIRDGSCLFYRHVSSHSNVTHPPSLLSFLSQFGLIIVYLSLLWSSLKPVKGSFYPLPSH